MEISAQPHPDRVYPTPERLRRGPVEELPAAIADEDGCPAHPFRAVDTLAVMERRGSITAKMRESGEGFRDDFAKAHLDPLQAADYRGAQIAASGSGRGMELGLRIDAARTRVWRAMTACGGAGSPGGSCLWHVVGWERSLKQWALSSGWNGRRITPETASGILIAALGALEAHYANGR